MENFQGQIEFAESHKEFMVQLEDMQRDVDYRATGGFSSDNPNLAFQMGELIRAMLKHMDVVDETIEQAMHEYECRVESREDEIGILSDKLNRIEQWVTDQRRLHNVMEIIKEDRF